MIRLNNQNTPSPHSDPVIRVSAAAPDGFDIEVGYEIPKGDYGSDSVYWYPCAYDWARTERGARRKARRLESWYQRYVERVRIAEDIG